MRAFFVSFGFDRDHRGLLTEGLRPSRLGASLATGTTEEEGEALAAFGRRVATNVKEGEMDAANAGDIENARYAQLNGTDLLRGTCPWRTQGGECRFPNLPETRPAHLN